MGISFDCKNETNSNIVQDEFQILLGGNLIDLVLPYHFNNLEIKNLIQKYANDEIKNMLSKFGLSNLNGYLKILSEQEILK